MKKLFALLISLVLCCACVFGIYGCSTEEISSGKVSHDTTKWFTATELENIGLCGAYRADKSYRGIINERYVVQQRLFFQSALPGRSDFHEKRSNLLRLF